jgi:hypothetical protein
VPLGPQFSPIPKPDRFGWRSDPSSSASLTDDEKRAEVSESAIEARHEKKWVSMFSRWNDFEQHHSDKIARRVQKGIPDGVRGVAWKIILDSHPPPDRPSSLDHFIGIGVPQSMRVIEADVVRTLHGQVMFEDVQTRRSLKRVLQAYANFDPEVGYIQGMGFIAAMFLSYLDEVQAFWCFATLMRERQHRRLFLNGFVDLGALNRAWDVLIEMKYPQIAEHLRRVGIVAIAYTTSWWLTGFMALDLTAQLRLRLFDRFVMFGYRALFSFGLTVLASAKRLLTSGEALDCLEVLQKPGTYQRLLDWRAAIVRYDREWLGKKEYRHCLKKAEVEFL